MTAGRLRARVAFERREDIDDGAGNPQSGAFAEVYRCAAEIAPKLGGEEVQAARLAGRQPFLVTVRACRALEKLGADWRLRDVRNGMLYNIRAIANPDQRGVYLELLVESGVAI